MNPEIASLYAALGRVADLLNQTSYVALKSPPLDPPDHAKEVLMLVIELICIGKLESVVEKDPFCVFPFCPMKIDGNDAGALLPDPVLLSTVNELPV